MNLGYACLTIGVKDAGISSCQLKQATQDRLTEVTRGNLNSLRNILNWNAANEIRLFRISSDIVPLASHSAIRFPWRTLFESELRAIGSLAGEYGIRLSMHPGQYTVLNSPDESIRESARRDLQFHADFLDAVGVDSTNKIILHIGGAYGDKTTAIDRFAEEARRLPDNVLDRLIIENDDTRFSVEDLLKVSALTGLPVVFDNLHNELNPSPSLATLSEAELLRLCMNTWRPGDGRPKMHYSQRSTDGRRGAHSATIAVDPFLKFIDSIGDFSPDVMLEVKDKNLSAIKCTLAAQKNISAARIEAEWARWKYLVLEKDQKSYNAIRELLKDKDAIRTDSRKTVQAFYQRIDHARSLPENRAAAINALQHVYGYVKSTISEADKRRWSRLFNDYAEGHGKLKTVKNHLHKCALTAGTSYLLDSLYFDL